VPWSCNIVNLKVITNLTHATKNINLKDVNETKQGA